MASTPANDAILGQLRQVLRNRGRRTGIIFFVVALCLGVLCAIVSSQFPIIQVMVLSGAEALRANADSVESLAAHHYVAPAVYLAFMFWLKRRQSRKGARLNPKLIANEPAATEVLATTGCLDPNRLRGVC